MRSYANSLARCPRALAVALTVFALVRLEPAHGAPAQAATPLRISIGSSLTMPMADFQNGRPWRGILLDIANALSTDLRRPVEPVVLPRLRVEGAEMSGKIDLTCYMNPAWTRNPDAFHWTEPLFMIEDVLFANTSAELPAAIGDIAPGRVVSTVRGYVYPQLAERFADRTLVREDADTQENVLLKVSAGRTPYGMSNRLTLEWFRRMTPDHHIGARTLVVAESGFHCSIPKASPVPPQEIIGALHRLRDTGRLQQILARYR